MRKRGDWLVDLPWARVGQRPGQAGPEAGPKVMISGPARAGENTPLKTLHKNGRAVGQTGPNTTIFFARQKVDFNMLKPLISKALFTISHCISQRCDPCTPNRVEICSWEANRRPDKSLGSLRKGHAAEKSVVLFCPEAPASHTVLSASQELVGFAARKRWSQMAWDRENQSRKRSLGTGL